eukprot:scaffold24438_cov66-Skeletonema_marinoi.AAC.1
MSAIVVLVCVDVADILCSTVVLYHRVATPCLCSLAATPPQKNDEKEKEESVNRREEKGLIYSCIGAYHLSHHVGIATSYRALSVYGAF